MGAYTRQWIQRPMRFVDVFMARIQVFSNKTCKYVSNETATLIDISQNILIWQQVPFKTI